MVVVPAHSLELPHRSDAGHDGQIALAAYFRRGNSAGNAGDPNVGGFEH
jgi:hypothetical protein